MTPNANPGMARPRGPTRAPLPVAAFLPAALVSALIGCGSDPAPAPVDVVEASIAELRAAVLEGRTTCRMVVQAHLDRIAAYDGPLEPGGTPLGAMSEVNPRALAVADSLDAWLASGRAGGGEPGPLFCAPMLVKDNFDTHDLPTTAGSMALAGTIPPRDAFMVARIRQAGAVIVGKTNMAEWAFSPRQTVSSSYGTTANAYDRSHTPAGSSGGTASGVAASFGVAGLGSDTGNSIRGPSSHLALVGIRSTLGLTSRSGVVPLFFDRDVAGPMARSVEDAARIFQVVTGPDPDDPYTELGRAHAGADYLAFLEAPTDPQSPLAGVRLGVLRSFAQPESSDPAVLALFENALRDLEGLGATLVDPWDIEGRAERLRAVPFCRRFRQDLARYMETRRGGTPFVDVNTVLEAGAFGPDVEGGLRSFSSGPLEGPPSAWAPPCPEYGEHPERQALRAAVEAALDAHDLDAFIFPTWSHPPAPLDRANEAYRGDNSQGLVPVAGLPAITVPMGFVEVGSAETEASTVVDPAAPAAGLPAGLQVAGPAWSEALLFRVAHAYERSTRHRRPPPGLDIRFDR
jgi:amidase